MKQEAQPPSERVSHGSDPVLGLQRPKSAQVFNHCKAGDQGTRTILILLNKHSGPAVPHDLRCDTH